MPSKGLFKIVPTKSDVGEHQEWGTLRAHLLTPTETLKTLGKLREPISSELWKMVKGLQRPREIFINTKATAPWWTGSQ